MSQFHVLFNPNAGNNTAEQETMKIKTFYNEKDLVFHDMTKISDYKEFFNSIDKDTSIIISGGDGTLNRFVNDTIDIDVANEIFYFASGSGNDFLRDMNKNIGDAPFNITKFLKNLPIVTINDKTYRFINGVGYGIDGYCCEVGDKERAEKPGENINYASIAIKGLLFHFKPANAKITIDGKEHYFKKVWLAPCMNGHYYGGGMIPTPDQDRLNEERTVSVLVWHGSGKIRTLSIFPSIFKGQHIKHSKVCEVFKGKDVTVEFDRPTAAQIDGETILNVTSYHALSSSLIKGTVNV